MYTPEYTTKYDSAQIKHILCFSTHNLPTFSFRGKLLGLISSYFSRRTAHIRFNIIFFSLALFFSLRLLSFPKIVSCCVKIEIAYTLLSTKLFPIAIANTMNENERHNLISPSTQSNHTNTKFYVYFAIVGVVLLFFLDGFAQLTFNLAMNKNHKNLYSPVCRS